MDTFINISPVKKTDLSPTQDQFPLHIHSNYEILCFLSGDANYIVEGTAYPLHKGDFILIRQTEAHRLSLTSDSPYNRIIVNFSPKKPDDALTKRLMAPFNDRPSGSQNHYPASDFPTQYALHCMEEICSCDDHNLRCAYLTVILNEFSAMFEKNAKQEKEDVPTLYAEIFRYINRHISESISLQQISDRFFISKSQLNRNFKRIIGSTVWDYIIEKRLLLAKKYIEEGASPTKVYLDCGFNDYTAFYRAYRSKFGISPSKTVRFNTH